MMLRYITYEKTDLHFTCKRTTPFVNVKLERYVCITTHRSDILTDYFFILLPGITSDPNQVILMAQIAASPTCNGPLAQLYYYISRDASQLVSLQSDMVWRRICSVPANG